MEEITRSRLTIEIDIRLIKEMKIRAIKEGKSVALLIENLCKDFLAKNPDSKVLKRGK